MAGRLVAEYDGHVQYTRYLERILLGRVSGHTDAESAHAGLVRVWLNECNAEIEENCQELVDMAARAWATELSLKRKRKVKP